MIQVSNSTQTPRFQFVQLADGRCHYRLDGPTDGKPLLLIHGATVPHWEFDRLVPFLCEAGYRCIRYDLFGHGLSDRPSCKHNYAFFVRQCLGLLDHLQLHKHIKIIGHSLGSCIGAHCLLQQPQRFDSLVMGAPVLDYFSNNKAAALLRIPLLGEMLTPSYVLPMLMRRRARRYGPIEDGRWVQMFRQQIEDDGFARSLISLMRNRCLSNQRRCYERLQDTQHEILMLRGAEDTIVSKQQFDVMKMLLPRATAQEIPDTEHAMMITDPQRVSDYILDFLQAKTRT